MSKLLDSLGSDLFLLRVFEERPGLTAQEFYDAWRDDPQHVFWPSMDFEHAKYRHRTLTVSL